MCIRDRSYILTGPIASYDKFGFGLWLVENRTDGVPMGMCGLLKRDTLEDVDIGYALVPEFWSKGFAMEAAAAVLSYGKSEFGMKRIVAIVSPQNDSSIRLLEKLGFAFERMVKLAPEADEIKLFGRDLE